MLVGIQCLDALFPPQQEDPFRVKPSVFNSQLLEHPSDPFHSEDPFKTDPFKGDWLRLLSVSTIELRVFLCF